MCVFVCVCVCVCVCQVLTNDLMCSNKPSYSGGLFRTPVAFALKHNFTFQCVCTKASSRVCLLHIRDNDIYKCCAGEESRGEERRGERGVRVELEGGVLRKGGGVI